MGTTRLEAFSDGMIAIFITIMVLEMKVPHGDALSDLLAVYPVFLSYVLSFIYVGIYWNNHHHMIHTLKRVTGGILWANLHLMFWLSLVPFTTAWMGENHFAAVPTALYGFVLLMAALAWIPLSSTLIEANGGMQGKLAKATGGTRDWKAMVSPPLYLAAIVLAFFEPILSCVLYAVVAAIWFIPDRRIEKKIVKT